MKTDVIKKNDNRNCLNTAVLPEYNCSNCEHFIHINLEKVKTKTVGWYAIECRCLVHPDCILRGFEGHSKQHGHSQTLNKIKK